MKYKVRHETNQNGNRIPGKSSKINFWKAIAYILRYFNGSDYVIWQWSGLFLKTSLGNVSSPFAQFSSKTHETHSNYKYTTLHCNYNKGIVICYGFSAAYILNCRTREETSPTQGILRRSLLFFLVALSKENFGADKNGLSADRASLCLNLNFSVKLVESKSKWLFKGSWLQPWQRRN